ncbi:hypothetical protein AMTR_s00010p00245980 [Amborella trichopoda]|uniref:Uncharacterized protein n=1 Tax=Amborella trichopoda TaxID=13333 RepID=W1NGM6_AMBTC|nr:hypothetical protein AMTR_s00010p00245980 [Amborella trichopoda]
MVAERVLERALQFPANPNYKVLSSSYLWITGKVLADSPPQLRSALQALLYKAFLLPLEATEYHVAR